VAVASAALFLHLANAGERTLVEGPARAYAAAIASAAQRAPSREAARAAFHRIVGAAKREDNVVLAVVVSEPAATRYRFLRRRAFLAHSDKRHEGRVLGRDHAGRIDAKALSDKPLYDVSQRVRRAGALVELLAEKGRELRVRAAYPVKRDGTHVATVIVLTRPQKPSCSPGAWPVGAALVGALLLAALAGLFVEDRRKRYGLIAALTALLAVASHLWLSHIGAQYSEATRALLTRLAQLGGAGSSLAAQLEASGFVAPKLASGAAAALWGSAVLGVLLCLLGARGSGARLLAVVRENRLAYTLLVPAGVGMMLLVFVPFLYGLCLGFFNHAHGTYTFVGLDNFVEILASDRPLSHPLNFYFTLGVTVLWTAANVTLHVTIGLALAMLLKDPLLRFKGLYRALLILPWAMPNYITALIWKGMFHHQFGAVNQLLEALGVEKVSWFSGFWSAFSANLVTNTWLGFPFMMVVALGALQSIPGDVYEAAAVDGASRRQAFFHITLPLLRPALFPAIVLGSIWTFNMFNIIYLVSEGEPAGATDILITEAYRWAFERADRYGLAAAYALLIFVILIGYTWITNRVARAHEDAA
ncbi:MAG: sugar ABC transporter permease, partial [Myxococcales bacterium]|nr:sugar ABC transporter permease [Myxococcales bacterium]